MCVSVCAHRCIITITYLIYIFRSVPNISLGPMDHGGCRSEGTLGSQPLPPLPSRRGSWKSKAAVAKRGQRTGLDGSTGKNHGKNHGKKPIKWSECQHHVVKSGPIVIHVVNASLVLGGSNRSDSLSYSSGCWFGVYAFVLAFWWRTQFHMNTVRWIASKKSLYDLLPSYTYAIRQCYFLFLLHMNSRMFVCHESFSGPRQCLRALASEKVITVITKRWDLKGSILNLCFGMFVPICSMVLVYLPTFGWFCSGKCW